MPVPRGVTATIIDMILKVRDGENSGPASGAIA
jgi:hypothetical protein